MSEPSSFESEDVIEDRYGSRLYGVVLVLLAGLFAAWVLSSFAIVCATQVLLTFAIVFHKSWLRQRAFVRVRAGADGLTIGDRFFPSAEITRGVVAPGDPPRVDLRFGFFRLPVQLEVSTVDEARSLLHALRLGGAQTVATFRTGSELVPAAFCVLMVLSAAAAFATPRSNLLPLNCMTVLIPLSALVGAIASSLSVGADGIVLRWLWRRRVIRYGAIASVTRNRRVGLTLALRSGEEVRVLLLSDQDREGAVIEERIREAMSAFHDGGAIADTTPLRRGHRSLHDWATALRALGAGANADLRTAPVPRDRLFRIVEDAAADPADRVAAAVALGGDRDGESRGRLRSAVEATVAPGLRVALEKAAGGESEAETEAALAAAEGEAPRERRA